MAKVKISLETYLYTNVARGAALWQPILLPHRPHQPVELGVAASSISDVGEIITRQRFVEGRLTQPDGDGVLLGMLIATSRIQCVVEAA